VSAGIGSGGLCGTNCCGLHPPAWSAKAGPLLEGSIGRAVGGPTPYWTPTDKSGIVVESGMLASSITGSGSSLGSSITMSSGGAIGSESGGLSSESSSGGSSEEVLESQSDDELDEDLEAS